MSAALLAISGDAADKRFSLARVSAALLVFASLIAEYVVLTSNRSTRGWDFIDKAEKLIGWSDLWLSEVREYGGQSKLDQVERAFFSALAGIGAIHEALLSAARCWKFQEWLSELQKSRETDPLIRYFSKARDAEVHNSVVKWLPGYHATLAWRIIDQRKVDAVCGIFNHPLFANQKEEALMRYIFGVETNRALSERMKVNPHPLPERVTTAGLEVWFALHGLILSNFTLSSKDHGASNEIVLAPENNAADICLDLAIRFYKSKLKDLRAAAFEIPRQTSETTPKKTVQDAGQPVLRRPN